MRAFAAIRVSARLLAVFLLGQPVYADEILNQFLARLGNSQDLTAASFFLNYAEAIARQGAQASAQAINGSTYIATLGTTGAYVYVQAGDIELTEAVPVQNQQAPMTIATSGTGTNNFGAIDVRRTNTGTSQGSYPMATISTMNGASTTVPVLGNVVLSGPPGTLPYETLSTSAIGSSNTGQINIAVTTAARDENNAAP